MLYLYMVWHQQRYIDIMITYISKKWIKMCLSVGRLKAIFVYVFAYSIGVFTLVEKVGASSIFLGTILREVSLWPGPGAVSPTQAGVVTFNSALFKISDVNGVWLKSLELKWKRNKSRDRITSNPEARDFLKNRLRTFGTVYVYRRWLFQLCPFLKLSSK